MRRVAVTGAGVISALGGTAAATWEGLVAGPTGIGPPNSTAFGGNNGTLILKAHQA